MVHEDAHHEPLLRACDEQVGEACPGASGVEDVVRDVDVVLRGADRLLDRVVRRRGVVEEGHVVAEVDGRLAEAHRELLELTHARVFEVRRHRHERSGALLVAGVRFAARATVLQALAHEAAGPEKEEDDESDVWECDEREDPGDRRDRRSLLEEDPRGEQYDVDDLEDGEDRDEHGRGE